MTTSALGSALSGLRLAQKAMDVTANNLSNATIEGYTRKTLAQESVIADGIGVGVRYGQIQRYVDQAVQRDYRNQLGTQGYLATREGYLSRLLAVHGSTDNESNINAQMGRLYNNFVALSADPDNPSMHAKIVSQAQQTARSLNTYHAQLQDMRNEVQTQLKTEVQELNGHLKQIADLNIKIKQDAVMGKSTAALEDLRDVAVKKVAEQLEVSYFIDGDNVLVLQTMQGHVLADTEPRNVRFDHSILTPSSQYPDSASGLIIELNTNEVVDIAGKSPGGRIGGLLDLRDKELIGYMTQLDELAHKTMLRFEEQGLTLFTDMNGLVPANNPYDYVGLAGSIQVNTAVLNDPSLVQKGTGGVPLNPGANDIIMNVVNYTFGRTKDASGTPHTPFNVANLGAYNNINISIIGNPESSLLEFAGAILDNQAKDYDLTNSSLQTESAYLADVQTRLLEGSAVNSDEELGRMIEIQKAYSANAKMIGTLDELFRDLLNAI